MHRWVKWRIEKAAFASQSRDHFRELDPDWAADWPATREKYYEQFLRQLHGGRLSHLHDALVPFLHQQDEVLSLGSGHCALEMSIAAEVGCSVACSDQSRPPWLSRTMEMFPELQFSELDVLADSTERSYDVVLCLGLAYIFGPDDMLKLMKLIGKSLKPRGRCYFDTAGPPDNLIVRAFHDVFLPLECRSLAWKNGSRVVREMHGYHYKTRELLGIAAQAGLRGHEVWRGSFGTDWQRSAFLNKLQTRLPVTHHLFDALGRLAPYGRILELSHDRFEEAGVK